MGLLLSALAIWGCGGFLALIAGRGGRASGVGATSAVAGCVLLMAQAVGGLGGTVSRAHFSWPVPLGSGSLGVDPLSAVFLLPIGLVCGLAAVYGVGYLRAYEGRKHLGAAWCFFNWLIAAMVLVVTARNAMLFLVAWEVMSLVSFFLVMFEDEREQVRQAGWTYAIASHLGVAFLLVLFALLGRGRESLDFDLLVQQPGTGGLLFLLALIGFGTKAGFVPLHIWLPEAHPAAPSHVSAVMSGVMIKMGIYGLLRTLTFLGPPAPWWGWLLLGVGATSALLGVLFALAQHDLKRLLAYCSVENVGIIALGLGLGLLGLSYGNMAMAALGLAGGLLHVWNHAVFKSLLFFGAGAVAHATGTREIDRLGGLLNRMPRTGTAFLVGTAAICGLPPLNGFMSELLVYLGALQGLVVAKPGAAAAGGLLVLGALALSGGLAVVGFAKTAGVAWLGEPRSDEALKAHEPSASIRVPMVVLAGACVLAGVLGPLTPGLVGPAVASLVPPAQAAAVASGLAMGQSALLGVGIAAAALLGAGFVLAGIRAKLLGGQEVGRTGTWDCGYAAPAARMQYTGSSFVRPVVELFGALLGVKTELQAPDGLFPPRATLRSEIPEIFRQRLYAPLGRMARQVALRLHALQQGRLQLYVLYVAVVLVVLLIWKLR